MSSWAGEVGARHAFLQNSYRFGTEAEAKAFIEQLKDQWIPKGFIWTTRTLRSKDPINARWDIKKKEAIRLDVTAAVTTAPAPPPMTVEEYEDETPESLVNER